MGVTGVSADDGRAGAGSPLRSRTLLVFLMVAVVVLGGAVTAVAVRQTLREPAQRELAGVLRGQFPQAPAEGWTVDGEQVGGAFVLPQAMANTYRVPGALDLGDLLVTSVYPSRSARAATLVAIDAATGRVRWTTDGGEQPSCADAVIDGLLACAAGRTVRFHRVSDGTLDHVLDVADPVSRIGVLDGDLITAGYEHIARGSTDDLTARWHTPIDYATEDSRRCPGSGDSVSFGATGDFVWFGPGTGAVVLDPGTGRRISDRELSGPVVQPGAGGLVGTICNGPRSSEVVVLTPDGGTRTHPSGGWTRGVIGVAPDDSGPYVAGKQVYARDGQRLWTITGDAITIAGDLVITRDSGGVHAFRRADGTRVWEAGQLGELIAIDEHRAVFSDRTEATAVDLADGTHAWQIPIDGELQRAGGGMAVVSATRITFLPPSGQATPATGGEITRCGRPPELKPIEYRSGSAGLVVKVELRAACPGGDIVSTDALRISVSEQNRPIAAAVFDFSPAPLVLPRNESDSDVLIREFTFPPGSFWRLPSSLGSANTSNAPVTVSQAGAGHVVQCEDQGVSRGPATAREPSPKTQATPIPAVRPAELPGDQEARALEALRAQADADRPFVSADLADRWVAQLSSKRPGLVAPDVDGRMVTWTTAEILAQHLRMRLQYPEVRLVWSDEWRTFDLRGWWVTIAGVTFPGPDEANSWCDARAIPVDECFAKLVSNTRDSAGTTKYRR